MNRANWKSLPFCAVISNDFRAALEDRYTFSLRFRLPNDCKKFIL
jgi:hypothetical protein